VKRFTSNQNRGMGLSNEPKTKVVRPSCVVTVRPADFVTNTHVNYDGITAHTYYIDVTLPNLETELHQ